MRGSRNDSTRTIVRRSDRAQWPESDYASATFEVATREPGAASERIGSMAGARSRSLGQVLAHVAGKFQHVDARNREDRLHRRVGFDDAPVVQLVLLDVDPDLLRPFRARHRLPTADGRQRRAQRLRGEKANAL